VKSNMIAKTVQFILDTPSDRGQQNLIRQVYMANENRFDAANLSQPLTTFASAWTPPKLAELLDAMFPPVAAPRRFEYSKYDNSEAFLSESDDVRGIGAEYKVLEYGASPETIRTINKGLTMRLDRELMVPGEEENTVQYLMNRLIRNEFRRGLAGLITASGVIAEKTWNSSANPDSDVRALLRAGQDLRGMRSDVVVYTGSAFDDRADAYEAQNTPAAGVAAGKSPEELARKFRVDRVLECDAVYTVKKDGAKTQLAGDDYVITYMAPMGQSRTDPSNCKRFFTPFGGNEGKGVASGGKFWVYREEHTAFVDITVAHYSNIVFPSTLGVKAIKIK
jgi:hypothetical protein